MARARQHRADRHRFRRRVGTVAVFAAAAGLAYPLWWSHRANQGGQVLLSEASLASAMSTLAPATCSGPPATVSVASSSAPGVLEVPSIGLVAPVLPGLDDSVLNVAVGHDPASPWPGLAGESVLEAHDVSYFTNLAQVKPGAEVVWLTRCFKAVFTVNRSAVLWPGALLDPPAGGSGLALVTCWPTNALFWTSQRYVVTAQLKETLVAPEQTPSIAGSLPPPITVPAPPALVAQGIDLDTNSLVLGVLAHKGEPSPAFADGPGPLMVERDALEVFFGARKSVLENEQGWWSDLAVPGLPFPRQFPTFGRTDITITVKGSSPQSVTIASPSATAQVVVEGGRARLASLT